MSRSAERGLVQRILGRVYDRIGSRIVLALIVGGWLVCAITAFLMIMVADGYLHLSAREFRLLLAEAQICALLGPALTILRARELIRSVLSWSTSDHTTENAEAAWHTVASYPATLVRGAVPIAAVLMAASLVFLTAVLDLPWWAIPAFGFTLFITVAGAFVVILFGLEMMLRPMLEDIAELLPPEFEPTSRAATIRTKALLPLPIVTLITAVAVSGFAGTSSRGVERVVVIVGIALLLGTVATAIFFIVTRSALDPIVALTAATRRARDGDLSTTVSVVSADDLGHLAADFNQMLVQLRDSQARIVAASDAARRRVERDLHDGAQQDLVLLNLKLGMVERAASGDENVCAMVREAREDLGRALQQLRDLAHGIYPAVLESEGIAAALTDTAKRTGVAVTVEADGAGRYPREIEAAVYFCCLEALQNTAKHAGDGARATVQLGAHDGTLEFEITDDGPGFDLAAGGSSGGLRNMIDRVSALGGSLAIDSEPGAGTTVRGSVPIG